MSGTSVRYVEPAVVVDSTSLRFFLLPKNASAASDVSISHSIPEYPSRHIHLNSLSEYISQDPKEAIITGRVSIKFWGGKTIWTPNCGLHTMSSTVEIAFRRVFHRYIAGLATPVVLAFTASFAVSICTILSAWQNALPMTGARFGTGNFNVAFHSTKSGFTCAFFIHANFIF